MGFTLSNKGLNYFRCQTLITTVLATQLFTQLPIVWEIISHHKQKSMGDITHHAFDIYRTNQLA